MIPELDVPCTRSRAREILDLAARAGEVTIADIGLALGLTTTAVRQQVDRLAFEGWLVRGKRRGGSGRPADVFVLSEQARRAFAHELHDFLRLLIEEIAGSEGPEKVHALVRRVSLRMAGAMEAEAGPGLPAERLARVAQRLRQRGTQAETRTSPSRMRLSLYTCPFHGLGDARRAMCAVEQEVLARIGGGSARLKQSLVDGERCCEFEVGLSEGSASAGAEVDSARRDATE